MYTTCAHCETRFRLHSSHLRAAQGLVRCAHCDEVFNALERLVEEPADLQQGALAEAAPTVDEALPGGGESEPDEGGGPSGETATKTQDTPPPSGVLAPQLGPMESASRVSRIAAGLLWATGITILLVLAMAQALWFGRDSLIHHPEGRALLEYYCELRQCTIPPPVDLAKLKIVDRVVASHPEVDGILRIQLTFENQAPFHQPFPVLQVSLFTRDGKLEAQRRFTADEYTGTPTLVDDLMQPGQGVEVELDVKDPGPHVTDFEFAFF